MFLDAMEIRIGMIAVGLPLPGMHLALGGRLGPGKGGSVLVDFGLYPEGFQGLTVEIGSRPAAGGPAYRLAANASAAELMQ